MEHFVVTQIDRHGYLAVLLLMTLESACIPIPSEAIMLFGGALAGGLVVAGVHLHLSVVGVALAGAAGNLIGSLIAYAVGRWAGRAAIERWGRWVRIRPRDLDRAEAFFERRGDLAVLVGRVLPVVRTFISLPAGIARMPLGRFAALTTIGCLPWTFALAFLGKAVASNWRSIESGFGTATIFVAVVIVAVIAGLVLRRALFGRRDLPGVPARASAAPDPSGRTSR
ncbi:MAG: DedA family protein [Acidimicrobiaceae bacterium]|nr:DedA family protein [Acidimicrobiaceae bacterium]